MSHGPSDDEIYDASQAMQDALYAMAEATDTLDSIGTAVNARLEHVNIITSLDPARIAAEFERIRTVTSRLAQSETAKGELNAVESRLGSWHGDAKAAFFVKIENVRSHLDLMAAESAHILNTLGTLYSIAFHARGSHLLLCRETEAAALREINNQEKREDKLQLALATKVVSAVLTFDPAAKVRSTLDAFVQIGEVTAGYAIDGNDAADVANNYLLAGTETTRAFETALERVHNDLRLQEGALAENMLNSDVYDPIHPDADITSPDFRYENFYSGTSTPSPDFDSSVEKERKRIVAEAEAHDSEVTRRLGGAE